MKMIKALEKDLTETNEELKTAEKIYKEAPLKDKSKTLKTLCKCIEDAERLKTYFEYASGNYGAWYDKKQREKFQNDYHWQRWYSLNEGLEETRENIAETEKKIKENEEKKRKLEKSARKMKEEEFKKQMEEIEKALGSAQEESEKFKLEFRKSSYCQELVIKNMPTILKKRVILYRDRNNTGAELMATQKKVTDLKDEKSDIITQAEKYKEEIKKASKEDAAKIKDQIKESKKRLKKIAIGIKKGTAMADQLRKKYNKQNKDYGQACKEYSEKYK